uniref:Uncharacterized protein n=1 Tax=Anopheles culicifacies TaxID=139723 RepID=A0A182LRM3_9DIPT
MQPFGQSLHLLNQSSVATSAVGPYQQRQQQEQHYHQHQRVPLSHRHHEGPQFDQPEFLPHQHQHQQSFGASSCLSTSTDAMSLDGLLDCVSTGTFSCPPSPKSKSYLDNGDGGQQSAGFYESLEELNYALKTLIISDSFQAQRNMRNVASAGTEPTMDRGSGTVECTVPFGASFEAEPPHQQGHRVVENQSTQECVAPSQHLVPEQQQEPELVVEEDDDLIKQRKLSDWYYIKTAPTKKPSSPFERRRANGSRLATDAARRTGRFPPNVTPRASNPDIAGDERLQTKVPADSKHPTKPVQGEASDRKYPSPVPKPRRLPPSMVATDSQQQPSWDQESRWHHQHPGVVTKSASSSSVNVGLRGHLHSLGGTGRSSGSTRLHSNSDLQQAGTRKAIAPALLQDDSLGSLDDSSSLAVLGGSLTFESSDDRERFSPYFRRRNPQQLVPQWFPPPPPPPYHYPHQYGHPQEQRNIYENFPPTANQHASMEATINVHDGEAKPEPLSPTPTARIRTTTAGTTGSSTHQHTNHRPAPTLYGIEEDEVFQYKVPIAPGASDKRPLPRPPIDSDDETGQGQCGMQAEKKSSLTREARLTRLKPGSNSWCFRSEELNSR